MLPGFNSNAYARLKTICTYWYSCPVKKKHPKTYRMIIWALISANEFNREKAKVLTLHAICQ